MENQFNISEIKVQFLPDFKPSERPSLTSSADAYKVLLSQWDAGLMQFLEEFKVIFLDNCNRVLGVADIAVGGRALIYVDMKTIFSIALTCCASKIVLSHNHPSGFLKPSLGDLELTSTAIEAGKALDIEVCDHLIIGNDGYFSFSDEGLI